MRTGIAVHEDRSLENAVVLERCIVYNSYVSKYI